MLPTRPIVQEQHTSCIYIIAFCGGASAEFQLSLLMAQAEPFVLHSKERSAVQFSCGASVIKLTLRGKELKTNCMISHKCSSYVYAIDHTYYHAPSQLRTACRQLVHINYLRTFLVQGQCLQGLLMSSAFCLRSIWTSYNPILCSGDITVVQVRHETPSTILCCIVSLVLNYLFSCTAIIFMVVLL